MLADPGSAKFDAILIATGSEVDLAMQAMRALADDGIAVRVVSMPCTNVFDAQPLEYRESVLPSWCRKRVAVEAGVTDFWRKYVGLDGAVVGIDTFGASAPAEALFKHFGFTVEHVVAAVKALALIPRVMSGGRLKPAYARIAALATSARQQPSRANRAVRRERETARDDVAERDARDQRADVPDADEREIARSSP